MICICAAFPLKRQKGLLLDRGLQEKLQIHIQKQIGYTPFLFNTEKGFYVFYDRKDHTDMLGASVAYYLNKHAVPHRLVTAHQTSNFFAKEIQEALNNPDASCFAWKNFISSFLFQLDPFKGSMRAISSLFKGFVGVVKKYGETGQLNYLKQKMNRLRAQVDVTEILN